MSLIGSTVPTVPYHPWRALRALANVHLTWTHLQPGVLALTDGRDRIWMDPRQRQAKRRSTLAHELAHLELGHVDGCTAREDAAADQLAARRLITLEALADAVAWARSIEEAADELWVDAATLRTRLDHLHPSERAHLRARMAARDDAC